MFVLDQRHPVAPLTPSNRQFTVNTRKGRCTANGNMPRLQSQCAGAVLSQPGCLDSPRVPSLPCKAQNETSAFFSAWSAYCTPFRTRPARPRFRDHSLRLYVRHILPSAFGMSQPEGTAQEEAPGQAGHPAESKRSLRVVQKAEAETGLCASA